MNRDDLTNHLHGSRPLPPVVGKRLRLIRAGHRYKAPCPFHNEKTASFYVGGWWFVCYGCGAEGDVVDFVMRHDRVSEDEAVAHIAADIDF